MQYIIYITYMLYHIYYIYMQYFIYITYMLLFLVHILRDTEIPLLFLVWRNKNVENNDISRSFGFKVQNSGGYLN